MSADTAAVRLQGLARTYRSDTGAVAAVAGLDLDVVPGSFTTLFGASGCGKTTTLRMVAGLERPDAGRVVLGPRTVFDAEDGTDVAPHRRGIGMVFQSFTVWPHLSVEDNVAYPLRAARVRRAPARAAAGEMLERVGLGGLGRRRTGALSGGQQQRVAIARALVHSPQVLLLDEPFSSLDGALRSELGADVRALQRDLGITVVYVTHDRREALTLSDRIAVLDAGRLVQEGGPRELYDRPATRLVARALGTTNLLTVTAPPDALPDGTHVVTTSVGRLRASGPLPAAPDRLVVNVRAEDVVLLPRGAGDAGAAADARDTDNVLLGTVAEATYRGPNVDTVVRVAAGTVRVRTAVRPEPVVGDTVLVTFPVARTTLLADDPSA